MVETAPDLVLLAREELLPVRGSEGFVGCQGPVSFEYTYADGRVSTRSLLPLALLHNPQDGFVLYAYDAELGEKRNFFLSKLKAPGTSQAKEVLP